MPSLYREYSNGLRTRKRSAKARPFSVSEGLNSRLRILKALSVMKPPGRGMGREVADVAECVAGYHGVAEIKFQQSTLCLKMP